MINKLKIKLVLAGICLILGVSKFFFMPLPEYSANDNSFAYSLGYYVGYYSLPVLSIAVGLLLLISYLRRAKEV